MKGSGSAVKLAERASYSCQTETPTKASGRMIRHQVTDASFLKQNVTSVSGKMMFIMAKVKSSGKTVQATRAHSPQVRRTDMVFTNGLTKLLTKAAGSITRCVVKVHTNGVMGVPTQENG